MQGQGPGCKRHSCTGPDCVDGVCVGPNCTNQHDESGGAEPLDPSDPEDPEDPEDPSDSPGEDICKIKTDIGRCGNGNYPVLDISSGQIRCDVSDNDVDSVMSACQRKVDDNIDFVQKYVSTEQSCCPSGSKKKRADYCPGPNQDPRHPPPNQCYATYTCPHALYPNVCGNAKSAILHRGKTSILTHVTGSKKHDTRAWYAGKFLPNDNDPWSTPKGGWRLAQCEVEEYPFGSGDPNRNEDGTSVLRLIPGGSWGAHLENQEQAKQIGIWRRSVLQRYRNYQQAQNPPQDPGLDINGLVYCMAFDPSFTAYLPEDLVAENFCNHYGVAFTLVNSYTGRGSWEWDPWFDVPNTGRKTSQLLYYKEPDTGDLVVQNPEGDAWGISAVVPPTWCQHPSPGRKQWDGQRWNLDTAAGFSRVGRDDVIASNRRCENIPPGTRRRRSSNDSDMMKKHSRSHPRDLDLSRSRPRALGAGGFLDPGVYRYFGCDSRDEDEDGVDPCSGPDNPCRAAELPTTNGGNPTLLDPPPPQSEGGLTTSTPSTPIITQPPSLPTNFIDCRHQNEDPGQAINSAYCVCSGSTFSESIATWVTPQNSCAYTAKPTKTIPGPSGPAKTTDTGACKVCSIVGQNNRACDDLPNCTPTPTPTPKRCITAHNYTHVGQYLTGTGTSIQVWDNGKQVCDVGSVKQGASDTTNWDYDCEDGAKVHVTDNGRVVEYTGGDGYFLAIPLTDGRHDKEDCGSFTGPAGTEHTLWCTIWEYAFDNGDQCDGRCPIMQTCGDRHCDFDGTCA